MADGGYQRTCRRCQHTWFVPSDIAEERPNLRAATSQYLSLIRGKFDDQVALRTHYQQLAAAAKCPQCGATSFTQQKVAESPASPEPTAEVPPSAPAAPRVPEGQIGTYVCSWASTRSRATSIARPRGTSKPGAIWIPYPS